MILIILFFGFLLRLISINQSLWIDEATSLNVAQMPFGQILNQFLPGDFHPPLYYFLLKIWTAVFGVSEISGRLLSVIFGIATIYVTYLIGKNLINKKTGLIAALFLATSGLHIYYSHETRMYAMTAFLATLMFFVFVKILRKESGVGDWLTLAVGLGILGLTDYLPLLILPVLWIYALITKQRPSFWKKFLLSHNILAIFALLLLPYFLRQLNAGINVAQDSPLWANVLGKFSLKEIFLIPVKFMIGRISFDDKFVYLVVVAFGFLIFGFLIFKSTQLRQGFAGLVKYLVYFWLLVPIIFGVIISLKLPVLDYFRFLFVLPAFYLISALGTVNLSKNFQKIFIIIVVGFNLITSGIYLSDSRFKREDWKGSVAFIESTRLPDSAVIFPSYSQQEGYRYYSPNAKIAGPIEVKEGYSEIWLVRYAQPISDPEDKTRKLIEQLGYNKEREHDFNGVGIWRYVK